MRTVLMFVLSFLGGLFFAPLVCWFAVTTDWILGVRVHELFNWPQAIALAILAIVSVAVGLAKSQTSFFPAAVFFAGLFTIPVATNLGGWHIWVCDDMNLVAALFFAFLGASFIFVAYAIRGGLFQSRETTERSE